MFICYKVIKLGEHPLTFARGCTENLNVTSSGHLRDDFFSCVFGLQQLRQSETNRLHHCQIIPLILEQRNHPVTFHPKIKRKTFFNISDRQIHSVYVVHCEIFSLLFIYLFHIFFCITSQFIKHIYPQKISLL